jgi:hypothetical protein
VIEFFTNYILKYVPAGVGIALAFMLFLIQGIDNRITCLEKKILTIEKLIILCNKDNPDLIKYLSLPDK